MSVTIGVGGPVGSGKTALLDNLCKRLRDRYSLAVITNDIYTHEDAEFLMRSGALPIERIRGVQTGGCPHTAIREDTSINHEALEDMRAKFPTIEIVFLGRLSERKGVPELLLALSHPVMKELRWRAVLAGDGPVEDYRRQAADMGLSGLVDMPGWLGADETRALCARADILVLPSHAEGLAMAVLEGLSHGLAVVTTRVGAHEEVISDGETGVFVPVGDKDALAAALAKLITDPDIRSRLAAGARAHYLNHFSMKAYMRSMENLYETISAQPQAKVSAQ